MKKLHLKSIRPPRQEKEAHGKKVKRGPDFRSPYNIPFMFKATGILKKMLFGHHAQITEDHAQPSRVEPGQSRLNPKPPPEPNPPHQEEQGRA